MANDERGLSRAAIESLRGLPMSVIDEMLGAAVQEQRVSNGSSGSFILSVRCFFDLPAGCFVLRTTSYRTYAYGTHYRQPTRDDFHVDSIDWFAGRAEMDKAIATWLTDLRSDND